MKILVFWPLPCYLFLFLTLLSLLTLAYFRTFIYGFMYCVQAIAAGPHQPLHDRMLHPDGNTADSLWWWLHEHYALHIFCSSWNVSYEAKVDILVSFWCTAFQESLVEPRPAKHIWVRCMIYWLTGAASMFAKNLISMNHPCSSCPFQTLRNMEMYATGSMMNFRSHRSHNSRFSLKPAHFSHSSRPNLKPAHH